MLQYNLKGVLVKTNIKSFNKFESKSSRAKGIAFHPKRFAHCSTDLLVLQLADNFQTMDSRLPTFFYNSAMGLSHGYIDRSVRGARWAR